MMTRRKPGVLVLTTGLFPDADVLEAALAEYAGQRLVRKSVEPASMGTTDWDRLLQAMLQAEKIVTL